MSFDVWRDDVKFYIDELFDNSFQSNSGFYYSNV